MNNDPAMQKSLPKTVHIIINLKGGSGKTETADVLEAALSICTDFRPFLVDVDDGNSGLTRRVGKANTHRLNWASGPSDAPGWLARNASVSSQMIFDIGSNLLAAELPISNFLAVVWRYLHEAGWRVIFYCVNSTNAPTKSFVSFLQEQYGAFAEFITVENNQDGSGAFGVSTNECILTLQHAESGLQSVRLSRQQLLSEVLTQPQEGFGLASALMAQRVYRFAKGLVDASIINENQREKIGCFGQTIDRFYTISRKELACDHMIRVNAELAQAHSDLVGSDMTHDDLLRIATAYRVAYRRFKSNGT